MSAPPPQANAPPPSRGRELRLALAMRGGVSLAVWIGGACAEIAALRAPPHAAGARRTAEQDDGFWRPLLDAAGYGGVRIDVLAGASAGGLNGALLAAALLYGVPFTAYRDVWLDVADLRALLRDPDERAPPSVLRGDDYFLAQLQQQLGALVAAQPASRELAGDYLDLVLTATLFDPTAVPVLDDWGGGYAEASHRASFRFRHNRFTSDFRHSGDPAAENAAAVDKLALAARATSSFPGMFEPATVRVRRPRHVGERAALGERDDFFGLFSDASRPLHRVIDGGVLNNIPVAKAVEAIATSSAQGPTERWLLYLHPSPEEPPPSGPPAGLEPDTSTASGPDTLRTVLAASSARGSAESVLDDLDLLRAHNTLVERYRAMRRALLSGLDDADGSGLLEAASRRWRDYRTLRVSHTARRVRDLLEDPVRTLGEDPFTTEDERWPLAAGGAEWSLRDRVALETALRAALRERFPATDPRGGNAPDSRGPADAPTGAAPPIVLGAEPLPRLAHVCLETVWGLERAGADAGALAALKERLYAVADVADLLVHLGDLFWPVYAARRPPEREGLARWAAAALDVHSRFAADPDANPTAAPDLVGPFSVLRAELRRRSAFLRPQAAPLPEVCWHELVRCCVTLALLARDAGLSVTGNAGQPGLGRTADATADAATDPDTAGLPPALLRRIAAAADAEPGSRPVAPGAAGGAPDAAAAAAAGEEDEAARALAALEVLTCPLQTLAEKPPQPIRFLRVAGSRRSPLEEYFPGGRLTVGDKLAGNELMNFAAFYKRSWRANDWLWGRLDAAATLVDLLVRPEALRRAFAQSAEPAAEPAAALVELVRSQVQRPVAAAPPLEPAEQAAWADHFAALWERHAGAVTAEVEAVLAGADGADLAVTRELLVARRQWELLVGELPVVLRAVAEDARDAGHRRSRRPGVGRPAETARSPEALRAVLASYRVGRETIAEDVGTPRFVRLAGDFVVVAWNAVSVGLGRAAGPLRPVGWALRLVRRGTRMAVAVPAWFRLPARLLRRLGKH